MTGLKSEVSNEAASGRAASLSVTDNHLIGSFVGRSSGPTLIVIGSLHGNEPGGAAALEEIAKSLVGLTNKLKGRVYFITGNVRAAARGLRFIDCDLNRSWTPQNLARASTLDEENESELAELSEIDQLLDGILITAMDEVFVLDLHSTSADGVPFATVGDTLRNREFAQKFPVTILLGIEEQLDGTMLEYLNNAGAVTLGFEGGQHLSKQTVENHEALVWLALVNSKILAEDAVSDIAEHRMRLGKGHRGSRIFEVRYRHPVTAFDEFEMRSGFNNFDLVREGEILGQDREGAITAKETGVLLMPLYQKLGEDGFFIGREISSFWLWLSGMLRRSGIQKIIQILPGVRRDPGDPTILVIDTRVARWFPLQVFHLLGFRRRRWVGNKLVVSRRRHDADGPFKWEGKNLYGG